MSANGTVAEYCLSAAMTTAAFDDEPFSRNSPCYRRMWHMFFRATSITTCAFRQIQPPTNAPVRRGGRNSAAHGARASTCLPPAWSPEANDTGQDWVQGRRAHGRAGYSYDRCGSRYGQSAVAALYNAASPMGTDRHRQIGISVCRVWQVCSSGCVDGHSISGGVISGFRSGLKGVPHVRSGRGLPA